MEKNLLDGIEQDRLSHLEEENIFKAAGWGVLDCCNPFYDNPSTCHEEGDKRTIACTPTQAQGPGFDFWWKEGECASPFPPEFSEVSVYLFKNKRWVKVSV